MSAKVVWYRGAWWLRTHWNNRKRDQKFGPSLADKRLAERTAERVNAKITLGTYGVEVERQQLDQERAAFEAARKRHEGDSPAPLPCDVVIRRWHQKNRVTMAPAYEIVTRGLIEHHLVPYFGSRDLRELRRDDMLGFIETKLNEGLSVSTIRNALSILRGVIYIECEEGRMTRNPAARIGAMIRRADRRTAGEVRRIESWSRAESEVLLTIAREHEPRFAPVMHFLLATGARRGEALALRWEDVDFSSR